MRKTLKSQGTIEQWVVLIRLSLEQMKLDTEIRNNAIYALHKGLQVMKFDIFEDDGIIVNIDYFDEQDLEDFRRFAAQIIKNPDAYRNPSAVTQPDPSDDSVSGTDETGSAANDPSSDASEADMTADTSAPDTKEEQDADEMFYDPGEPAAKTDQTSLNHIDDLIQPAAAESSSKVSAAQSVQKKKVWPTVLIILGIVVILAAAGFLGYRFYQQKQIPGNLLSQAVAAYNSGDYEGAITTAEVILDNYPDSDQVNTARTLKENAQAELDRLAYEAQVAARKEAAKSMFAITSQTLTGPDEDGDVHLFIGYTNHYSSNLVSVSFGVNFTDAEGTPVLIEGADSETVICTDEQGLAAGTALSEDLIPNFGPYRNATVAGFNLISVTVTYEDGTVLTLGSVDEISWVLVL